MWDWELIRNGSSRHRHEILSQYRNGDFYYTRAISVCGRDDEYMLHSHSLFELVYCVSGDVRYMADGVIYDMTPDSLLLINPAVPHRLFILSDAPFDRWTLYIPYAGSASEMCRLAEQCCPCVGKDRIGSALFNGEEVKTLRVLFERMDIASSSDSLKVQELTVYIAQALMAELCMISDTPARFSIATHKTADALLLFLSQNFRRSFTLDEIAERFHMSRDHCNHIFKQATGTTVIQYIIFNRVLYAKKLIAQGISATDAATRAGFSDYSNFFRTYRRITGRTPSEDKQAGGEIVQPEEDTAQDKDRC